MSIVAFLLLLSIAVPILLIVGVVVLACVGEALIARERGTQRWRK